MPVKEHGSTAVRLLARQLPDLAATALGAWAVRALCADADPEVFFPPQGDPAIRAREICGQCQVRDECLVYALENGEKFGIWGGLDPGERAELRRELRSRGGVLGLDESPSGAA